MTDIEGISVEYDYEALENAKAQEAEQKHTIPPLSDIVEVMLHEMKIHSDSVTDTGIFDSLGNHWRIVLEYPDYKFRLNEDISIPFEIETDPYGESVTAIAATNPPISFLAQDGGAAVIGLFRSLELHSEIFKNIRKTKEAIEHPESILKEAERLTTGARREAYGHPADDYGRTVKIWNAILGHKLKVDITASEAILCMIAVKMSREVHEPKRDNRVDMAGYANCLDMVEQRGVEELT